MSRQNRFWNDFRWKSLQNPWKSLITMHRFCNPPLEDKAGQSLGLSVGCIFRFIYQLGRGIIDPVVFQPEAIFVDFSLTVYGLFG